jgi:hypothetical protein
MAGAQPEQQGPQISENPGFDRIQWRIERAAWVVMTLILVAALLGFLGGGGLLTRATEESGGLDIRYNRFTRFHGVDRIEVTIPGEAGEARLTINESFLQSMEVEGVQPEPDSVDAGRDAVTYVFRLGEGEDAAEVTFTFRPRRIGRHSADFQAGENTVSFAQFALP